MAYRRTAIRQFSLANRAYRNAVVTFSKVDPITLVPTGVPAVLYAEPYGAEVAVNPYTMDAEGKFSVPLYVEEPVIAIVNASSVGVHQTGIIYPDSGGFKGLWATGTDYLPSEFVRDGAAGHDSEDATARRREVYGRARDSDRLQLQPRRHEHLHDDGRALPRSGDEHRTHAGAANSVSTRRDGDIQRRERRDRRGLYHPGGDTGDDPRRAHRISRDPRRHRPVHE